VIAPPIPRTARDRWVDVAAGGLLAAGVAHLLAALDHLSHEPRFVVFFLAVGAAQVVLSPRQGRRRGPVAVSAVLAATVGLLLLYVASRTLVLDLGPHADRPEDPDLLGTVVVLCELVAVVGLLALLPPRGRRVAGNAVGVIGLGLWLAWLTGVLG
jgi:hypothetical protein